MPPAKPRCPLCRTAVTDDATRPFCSERCRTIDLGNWLGESYRIPVDSEDEDRDLSSAAAEADEA